MLNGDRVPSSESLNGKRNEGNALRVTCVVRGAHLPIPRVLQSKPRLGGLTINNGRLKRRDDRDIEGRIAAAVPIAEEYIGRAGGSAWDQASELARGAKTCFLGGLVENIANLVMSGDPLAMDAAGYSVVSEIVARATASGAGSILFENWGAETNECRASKLLWVKSKAESRRRKDI